MEGQQFCLRWHNFQNTLLSSLPKLLDGGHLTDVTLSAGGRHIHAHKIILSACSYYFKELFKEHKNLKYIQLLRDLEVLRAMLKDKLNLQDLSSLQHPVIVLPGMEYANLCALVTFMYNGEVNIYQEQLPALLAMADTLHIRGLADIAGKNSRHSDNGLYVQPAAAQPQEKVSPETSIKKETRDPVTATETMETIPPSEMADSIEDTYNDQESIPYCVKTKPYYSINAKLNQREKASIPPALNVSSNKYTEKGYSDSGLDEGTPVSEDQITPVEDIKPPPIWDANFKFLTSSAGGRTTQTYNKSSVTCLICGKQLSNQYNLRVHMETHSNSSYSCTACSHVSRSRDALRKHVSYRHPVASPQKRPRYSTPKP